MTKGSKHSPLPWKIRELYGKVTEITDNSGKTIQTRGVALSQSDESESNSRFIVKAVNSHDKLVKALEYVLAQTDFKYMYAMRLDMIREKVEATLSEEGKG